MDSEPNEEPKRKVTLHRERQVRFGYRRFAPADLVAIDKACPPELFGDRTWGVTDEFGTHSAANIGDVLDSTIWGSVSEFSFVAIGRDGVGFPIAHVAVVAGKGSSSLGDEFEHDLDLPARQRVSRNIESILEHLPKAKGTNKFTTDDNKRVPDASPVTVVEAQAAPERRWWDPRRRPDSLLDWIFLTAAGGLAVVLVVTVVVAAILN